MAREFTEQDFQILDQAQAAIRLRGIDIENTEEGKKNGALIIKSFQDNSNVPVTLDGVISVVNQLADKLIFKSKIAKQLASSQLTAEEMDNLQDFMRRKPVVKLDGSEDGFHNAVLLVEWLRRYKFPINFDSLSKALEGFAYSQSTDPKQLLRWLEPARTSPRGRWSQDDDPTRKPGQLFTEERSSVWTASGRKNHAKDPENQPKPVVPVPDSSEAQWKKMADEKLGMGRTHSQKAELQEVYDNALATTTSYRKVYEAVSRVVKRYQTVRS
jgi:hypothetical protein